MEDILDSTLLPHFRSLCAMATAHKIIFLMAVSAAASAAADDCMSYDTEAEEGNKSEALKLKLVAIASILTTGINFPLLGRKLFVLCPENDIFLMVKAFASGVVLATGFVHILLDAFRSLTSSCISHTPWAKFPFSGFIAMATAVTKERSSTSWAGNFAQIRELQDSGQWWLAGVGCDSVERESLERTLFI
ncbi:zinc transporter 1-like [Salvia miltiorrhiza]|uniref:zinc transporter 1-like n=1 Tax=Salvia miltiorrhiza TaxID=226208 RepID=UPI0025AD1D4C|nr:zinc transporter 1-like [Salvia miltiorrhiza]